jgi:hypothetical protein
MKSITTFLSTLAFLLLIQNGYSQVDSAITDNSNSSDSTFTTFDTAAIDAKNKDSYKTLFGNNKKSFGGYFGANAHFTKINNTNAVLIGGEITGIINRSFNIGLQGFGLVTPIESTRQDGNYNDRKIGLGYGGIKLEPVFFYNSIVHFSIPMLIGAGGIVEYKWDNYYSYYQSYSSDAYFLFEPGLSIEVNLLDFMRFSTGASYRITSDIDMEGINNTNLNGFNFDLSLKFGWF